MGKWNQPWEETEPEINETSLFSVVRRVGQIPLPWHWYKCFLLPDYLVFGRITTGKMVSSLYTVPVRNCTCLCWFSDQIWHWISVGAGDKSQERHAKVTAGVYARFLQAEWATSLGSTWAAGVSQLGADVGKVCVFLAAGHTWVRALPASCARCASPLLISAASFLFLSPAPVAADKRLLQRQLLQSWVIGDLVGPTLLSWFQLG